MNTRNILTIFVLAVLFGCKASQLTGPSPSGSGASVFQVTQILDTVYSEFYTLAQANSGSTPEQVMMMTAAWIQTLPTVQSIGAIDSLNLDIQLKSGLHSIFSIIIGGPDSIALTRGGAPRTNTSGEGIRMGSRILSTNIIKNKDVLIYCPFIVPNGGLVWLYRQGEVDSLADIVRNAGQGFNVTISDGSSLNDVNSFGNYGLVLIETHGLPFGFYSGVRITAPILWYDSVTQGNTDTMTEAELQPYIDHQLGTGGYNLIRTGTLSFGLYINLTLSPAIANWQKFLKPPVNGLVAGQTFDIIIRSEYLQTLPSMKNTVIVGNFCYSGWSIVGPCNSISRLPVQIQYPIATTFENLQPISYYSYGFGDGYSSILDNKFAKMVEDSLLTALIVNDDSTGDAYLRSGGSKFSLPTPFTKQPYFYFLQNGPIDYSYIHCGDTLLDARDGQKYTTVCIGNQIWMAQDLNFNAPGSVYDTSLANPAQYGRYYDWNTLMQGSASSTASPSGVQGVCPHGWHVPSAVEWNQAIATVGGFSIAGGMMKSTSQLWDTTTNHSANIGATNSSGFSALPAGYFNPLGGTPGNPNWIGTGQVSYCWSATSNDLLMAIPYFMEISDATVRTVNWPKTQAMPCRCVKDP